MKLTNKYIPGFNCVQTTFDCTGSGAHQYKQIYAIFREQEVISKLKLTLIECIILNVFYHTKINDTNLLFHNTSLSKSECLEMINGNTNHYIKMYEKSYGLKSVKQIEKEVLQVIEIYNAYQKKFEPDDFCF